MKFVMSYSTGKDSVLALDRMTKQGHQAVALLVMYNTNAQRSWFHGTDAQMLEAISKSLDIPLLICKSNGEDYNLDFEKTLTLAKEKGASACVFGDIDIESHKKWNEERCKNAGLDAILPLWQENRESLVNEVITLGYKCIIKCICDKRIPIEYLGRVLDEETIKKFDKYGIDVCGENGEYHTLVLDGPLFKVPIQYKLGEKASNKDISYIDIKIN